ncbi:MAG: hypothetical protein JW997_00195, partial [Actinobacteria bacterium]|nr:hypothetical protein [Actinomycetota bacterium]
MTDYSKTLKYILKSPIFVLQKHDSIMPHFDLRLEIRNGVLKSWTLPSNPFLEVKNKTHAVLVNDHYLPWAYFEGFIHEGAYGRGPVMVWDIGKLKLIEFSEGMVNRDESYQEKGSSILFEINGKKIKGIFELKYCNTFDSFIYWSFENTGGRIDFKTDHKSLNFSALSGHSIEYIASKTKRKELPVPGNNY